MRFSLLGAGNLETVPLLVNPRAGIPAPPDSPANVPDAPPPPPGPSEPLEPGFPDPSRVEDDDESDEQ